MSVAVVTGSSGLVGAETVRFLADKGLEVVGIDNDMRKRFFGEEASTDWSRRALESEVARYRHVDADIRDHDSMNRVFSTYGADLVLVVHAAAQPSHDWAASDPKTDFTVNANGTLVLLEATRAHAPDAVFVFTSTNKVYGDTPNRLPLVELPTRWEIDESHPYHLFGIDETMSVDDTTHSLFGVSKLAADVLVQEYGRYFGLRTGTFRGGCLTGPGHAGTQLHGFLAYLVKSQVTHTPYTIIGYGGKQVRDNIHSYDLANMFYHFFQAPRAGAVYNAGGGRERACSVLEAIALCEEMTGEPMEYEFNPQARIGDHMWWISDTRRFEGDYPDWRYEYDLRAIMEDIVEGVRARTGSSSVG